MTTRFKRVFHISKRVVVAQRIRPRKRKEETVVAAYSSRVWWAGGNSWESLEDALTNGAPVEVDRFLGIDRDRSTAQEIIIAILNVKEDLGHVDTVDWSELRQAVEAKETLKIALELGPASFEAAVPHLPLLMVAERCAESRFRDMLPEILAGQTDEALTPLFSSTNATVREEAMAAIRR